MSRAIIRAWPASLWPQTQKKKNEKKKKIITIYIGCNIYEMSFFILDIKEQVTVV